MRQLLLGAVLMASLCIPVRADLAAYVAKADPTYSYTQIAASPAGSDVQYVELFMISQTWRDIAWKHKMVVVCPAKPGDSGQALLIISGGSWRDGREKEPMNPNSTELRVAQAVATATGMPVAVVQQVPFQPIFDGLKEDQAIAFTFNEYLKSGQEDWPLLFPMVKAAVRAMDTVQDVVRKQWQIDVSRFIVTGASKRGWTTWLTGAADDRVAAIAPMVIDVLNMGQQMKKQREEYGGYSEQVGDYTRLNIQDRMETDAGRRLLAMVDPFAYRQKLTMPKLILLGTNDPYWTVDALNLYYDQLPGEKHILYFPNAGHGLGDVVRIVSNVSALALRAAGKLTFPRLTWEQSEQAGELKLVIRSDVKPASVTAWVASAPTRDFRKATWMPQPLKGGEGGYSHQLAAPQQGYSAMFGEAVYDIDGRKVYLSTSIRVIGANGAKPTPASGH